MHLEVQGDLVSGTQVSKGSQCVMWCGLGVSAPHSAGSPPCVRADGHQSHYLENQMAEPLWFPAILFKEKRSISANHLIL